GRAIEEHQPNGAVRAITKREYDALNRQWRVSTPSSISAFHYSTFGYDAIGRRVSEKTADNALTTYLYDRNVMTVTDPALKQKTIVYDAFGRVESVTENPSVAGSAETTRYAYNSLDGLVTVCPPGGTLSGIVCSGTVQARGSSYDRLGRLTAASNPESGYVSYLYDETASVNGTGNLTSRVQWRGSQTQASVTTRYHYDNLNRMTSKTYSGNPDGIVTPTVNYEYDVHNPAIPGVTSYSKGRRTRVASGTVVNAVDSYDAMGRATRSRQTTESQTYRFGTDTLEGYEYQRNG
ncbi:MAG: hypothetical protein JNL98_42000, partial [Bryobacterales bacterium]|nr:hypothetical protein [Bryobacterales bacterium]